MRSASTEPDPLAARPIAPDLLAVQLVASLSPADASGVTAGILTRLRNDGLLVPHPFPPEAMETP